MLDTAVKTQIMNAVDKAFDDQTKVLADLVRISPRRVFARRRRRT